MLSSWARMWDIQEKPTSLALMRALIGAVMFGDYAWAGLVGVVDWLWLPAAGGGLPGSSLKRVAWVYEVLPAEPWAAWLIWSVALVAAFCMMVGLFSRTAVVVTLVMSAQLALINVPADRGIELVLRDVLLILAFAQCGRGFSVDAWLKTGKWTGDGGLIPAWPRHLLILQLAVIYQISGVSKFAGTWWPAENFSAIYYVLENPIYSRWDIDWGGALFPLTQAASILTLVFEWSAWLLPVAFWYRFTSDRPGRLRALFNRIDVRLVYAFGGFALHIGIEVLMSLGSFAIAMLALYPVFIHPDEWARVAQWVRRKTDAAAAAAGVSGP